MYQFKKDAISGADDRILAKPVINQEVAEKYTFKHLEYPHIYIPSRGLAHSLMMKDEIHPEIVKIKKEVQDYNDYLEFLKSIPGFLEFFVENNCSVCYADIASKWSRDIAEQVFELKHYRFYTDLTLFGFILMDRTIKKDYEIEIEGTKVILPIGEYLNYYPSAINGKPAFWNFIDNGHDFCYDLWELLDEPISQHLDEEGQPIYDEDDPNAIYYHFRGWDLDPSFRTDDPEPQFVKIFNKLESLNYIKSYTIYIENNDPRWQYCCKIDSTLDLALVDTSFLRNKLQKEQIELLLWSQPEELAQKPYFLTDENNNQYLSSEPGSYGGHRKLKIYGRLDCPSAAKYLEKGQYVKQRVFFKDTETAIKAGYHPCARCMPVEYKKWKAEQEEARFQQEYWAGYEQGFYQ